MQATLSKGKQNMIYKINRQRGKGNFKKTEAYKFLFFLFQNAFSLYSNITWPVDEIL